MSYTIQNCSKCKKSVKVEALNFLLNLDKKIVCSECQKEAEITDADLEEIEKQVEQEQEEQEEKEWKKILNEGK